MLSDVERKVLRIIENYTITRGKPPTLRQLSRFTGRRGNRNPIDPAALKTIGGINPEGAGRSRTTQSRNGKTVHGGDPHLYLV